MSEKQLNISQLPAPHFHLKEKLKLKILSTHF